ncbi:MAG TPA: hypothetical protein VLJ76_11585 [Gaiellaceae bacterium]|nr:hypothetical protein [Gaiellaceae bacterium]
MRQEASPRRYARLRWLGLALTVAAICGAAAAAGALAGPKAAAITPTPSANCQLGHGIQHVIELTFDNVHFNRDNPNVLSDLEQMPALENFITQNGTMLSNNYTPMIAHTADDSLTNYTGLYGDRHGQGITNTYETYVGGTPTSKSSFAYWTGTYNLDAFPNMPYSPKVPAAGSPPSTPPAPWAPFTRAGCDVGDVSTANMVLENTNPDLQNVFGPSSPEVAQYNADTDSFKDQETNDYVGVGVHCAQSDSFCSTAMATKFGQGSPSNTQVPDLLPNEPGGYNGFDAVFGHKYLTPQLAQAANAGQTRNFGNGDSWPVTDGSGNLTDLNGQTMKGAFSVPGHGFTPGFPGFGPISAAQTLAYIADMQETGVPVTYGYISDVHEKKTAGGNSQTGCTNPNGSSSAAQGPADPCDVQNLQNYNLAFTKFFQRLADDGITPANTLFVITADEGDHFAGSNANRAVQPACTGIPDTATYSCSYATVSGVPRIGEQQVSIHGLLQNQEGNSTPFYNESQGNSIYINNQPGPNDTVTRQMERDLFAATANDVFDGSVQENITNYEADPTVEQLLHFVSADAARTPTFTLFPKPDFFFTIGASDGSPANQCASGVTQSNAWQKCSQTNASFAWDHGYYAPEIDNTWLGLVGPGVAHNGIDGSPASGGPNSDGTDNSVAQLVTPSSNHGTWADHTDTRPTLMALTGLKDDYTTDGRVLTEDLTIHPGKTGSSSYLPLATCYKQLNSSVGRFGTDVLVADTAALRTGSNANDSSYQLFSSELKALGTERDSVATTIKNDLFNAEFNNTGLGTAAAELAHCNNVLKLADTLRAAATSQATATGTTCSNATYTGTTASLTVPSGSWCILAGASVTGALTVQPNGVLISFTGFSVGGTLTAGQNAELDLYKGSIGNDLSADRPALDLGFGGPVTIAHDATISNSDSPNGAFVDVCQTTVNHDLKATGLVNTGEVEIGDDEFCPASGGNSVSHDLHVDGSTANFVDVGNNSVGHDLSVNGNHAASGGYIDVSDNTVSHDASCSGNNPALSKDGAEDHANSAGHNNSCG